MTKTDYVVIVALIIAGVVGAYFAGLGILAIS